MDLGLNDKIAIITGSSRGLGLASAQSLAAEGCLVCLCGRVASTLENARRHVAERAGSDERVISVVADLSRPEGVEAVIAGALDAFGAIDILVNSVSPGSILFEGGSWWKRQQENPVAIAEFVRRELPFGRFGTPEEVADVVAFLSSSRASWISGTSVVVDGSQSRAF